MELESLSEEIRNVPGKGLLFIDMFQLLTHHRGRPVDSDRELFKKLEQGTSTRYTKSDSAPTRSTSTI